MDGGGGDWGREDKFMCNKSIKKKNLKKRPAVEGRAER